jgi:hypothetical protein
MATVAMRPHNLSEAAIDAEKSKLSDFFRNGPGRDANLTTLYFQRFPFDLGGGRKSACELVFGPDRLPGSILQTPFRPKKIG